jgi:hypothetical protein
MHYGSNVLRRPETDKAEDGATREMVGTFTETRSNRSVRILFQGYAAVLCNVFLPTSRDSAILRQEARYRAHK